MKKRPPNHSGQQGEDLFNELVKLTGIPGTTIERELKSILERKKINIRDLTLDQVRVVVATYLREIMGNMLERVPDRKHDSWH